MRLALLDLALKNECFVLGADATLDPSELIGAALALGSRALESLCEEPSTLAEVQQQLRLTVAVARAAVRMGKQIDQNGTDVLPAIECAAGLLSAAAADLDSVNIVRFERRMA